MEEKMGKSTTDHWSNLKKFTDARIALGRSGCSLPTKAHLEFQLAHARARDSVHSKLNIDKLIQEISNLGLSGIKINSMATDRLTYLKRPDLGRKLSDESKKILLLEKKNFDLTIIVGDGLSAKAAQNQVIPLLNELLPKLKETWKLSSVCIVEGARVAIGDEIGEILQSQIILVLIGERPGLSSPDSLGAYITYNPKIGKNDSERNCVSNIRPEGLDFIAASKKIFYLLNEAITRKITGIGLKDEMVEEIGQTVKRELSFLKL
jgi:ethanolamine ammonia-lyase small subunit